MYEAYKRLLQNIKQKTGRKLIVWRIVKIRYKRISTLLQVTIWKFEMMVDR